MRPYRLRIDGAPRTKKSHNQLAAAGERTVVLPSKQWRKWYVTAHIVGNHGEGCDEFQWPLKGATLPAQPYNVTALFYRDAERGDAVGYYQGLADLLEKRGVIPNDKWLVSWDGSRLLVDPKRPRVEVTLTPIAEAA